MRASFTKGISRRLMLSLGILGTVGAIAGLGTYAQFTDSTSATQSVSTGTVDINVDAAGATNRFSESSTLVAAGDTIQRAIDLKLAGTLDLSSVTLASSAPTTSSTLDTDATDGLQLLVEECSVAWTEAGSANARTYTCTGTKTTARTAGPVIQSATALTLSSVAPGDKHLVFKWTLPSSATQAAHGGKSSVINYDFVGVQRAATNK